MNTRRAGTWLVAATVAAAVLTGCGDDADSSSSTTSSQSVVSVTVTETASPTNGGPANDASTAQTPNPQTQTSQSPITGTLPVQHDASTNARLTVTDVRVGGHDGFDRVVFEFGGVGTPGWRVQFTDDPRQDGSGDPVIVPGRAVIAVTLIGVGYPGDTGVAEYSGPNPVAGVGGITQVNLEGVFEGQQLAFIGVSAAQPAVAVSALSSPTRLVIDIAR
ncbi:hypothetical protein MUG78_06460 [Gordonia alkaliphila]|uniref:AMIN-like domain-containing (lipo)protein n=1 Tax=Gordonia alkaliphila TaxID=1053547 RepID=UPI001FF56D24|nr:hypothetical protein [Gordonia alkaliphila]MCK0439117.1 hypothetical protein [Gordonia alkaliphila]